MRAVMYVTQPRYSSSKEESTKDSEITEELASMQSMKGTTTGKDLLMKAGLERALLLV